MMYKIFTLLLFAACCQWLQAQHVRKITYDEAIAIALGESYTSRYYKEDMEATHYSYLYTKAQFKPMLDLGLYTPSWNEEVQGISQVDGLPVYNSVGTLKAGGDLSFTYVLPTGGNLALASRMYWENYRTTLSQKDNEKLEQTQVYSRVALTFSQPVFTANTLRENMRVAALEYQKSKCYFTRVQMNIIYNVTQSFYEVYQADYEHKINLERLKNSREAYRITKLKQETGNLPEGENLIAEIAVAQDEARVLESEGRLDDAKDDFKLLVGLDLKEEIDVEVETDFETFPVHLPTAIDEALRNRMEIQENNLDIELQQIEVKRARRQREFKGKISAYYDFTGLSTRDHGSVGDLVGSSFRNMADRPSNRSIELTLSYPIADWGRAKNLVRSRQVRLKQRKLDLDNTKRGIEKEIREIVRSVYEAEKRYRLNQRNRQAAQESYRISQLRFGNGDLTSQELFIEQERLAEVQLAYIRSYITYRLSVADLNRKTMYDFAHNRSYLLERTNGEKDKTVKNK